MGTRPGAKHWELREGRLNLGQGPGRALALRVHEQILYCIYEVQVA